MDIRDIKKLIANNTNYGFKLLHDIFGFDYLRSYGLYYIAGRFTFNQIEKMIGAEGYNILNSTIALLMRDPSHGYSKRFHLIQYSGTVDIDFKPYKYSYRRNGDYNRDIDHFCRKSDVEDMRKRDTAETIIIVQNKNNLHKVTPAAPDFNYLNRFNISHISNKDISYAHDYISDIQIKDYQTGRDINRKYIGQIFYSGCERYKKDIRDIIDKSGYFVDNRRADLKRRAAALRAEREKAAYQATNNAEMIDKLYQAIISRRDDIITLLNRATTSADMEKIAAAMNKYNGLPDIVRNYELLKARDASKGYSSITSFQERYNNIMNALNNIIVEE